VDLLREVKALAGHGQPEQAQVEEDDTGRHWQGSHQSPAEVLARLGAEQSCPSSGGLDGAAWPSLQIMFHFKTL
jgi:hypothetical protein